MRSNIVKEGLDKAAHRSLLKALGITDEEMSKPFIGIVSSANEIIPGHMHLKNIVEGVKAGVYMGGAVPFEFSTIGICDGLAMNHDGMRYSLPSRDLIAVSIEYVSKAMPFDGMVYVSNCDKITPGMLIAMGRINIPSVLISGGPMLAGVYRGKHVDLITVFESVGKVKGKLMDEEDLKELEDNACPTAGSCAGLFTANTMNSIAEALGVAPIGNGTIPAVYSERIRLAKYVGKQVVQLVSQKIYPRDIVNIDSFYNAVALDVALGGSTNTVLHLPAIAESFGIKLDIEIFDELSRKIPQLCSLSPVGHYHIEDLHYAGGIAGVLKRLCEMNMIKGSAKSIMLNNIGEIANRSSIRNEEVIRPVDKPFYIKGGIAVMKGTLAKEGAVAKLAGVPPSLFYHKGRAIVFENGEEALQGILNGKVKRGSVIVIRNEGLKGGPGMREMLSPTSALAGLGLIDSVPIITDGRFSGGSHGAVIGHICPEAAEDGLIAYVENEDLIEIDFDKREVNLLVDNEIVQQRRKNKKSGVKKL